MERFIHAVGSSVVGGSQEGVKVRTIEVHVVCLLGREGGRKIIADEAAFRSQIAKHVRGIHVAVLDVVGALQVAEEIERPVVAGHGVKSVSNEITFDTDLADTDVLHKTLLRLCEKVAYRLRQKELQGRTIHLKLRYEGFETLTRNKSLSSPTANTELIYKVIFDLFSHNYDKTRKVRLLGVGVSGFPDKKGQQLSLFDKLIPQRSRLDDLEDIVRKKFGKNAISRAEGMKKTKDDERWFE